MAAKEIFRMKNITLAIAVALTLFTVGCKKKGGGDSAAAMAKMTEFKDRMCKCAEHDAKCAQAISDEMTKWGQEQGEKNKNAKPNEEDVKKMAPINEEL